MGSLRLSNTHKRLDLRIGETKGLEVACGEFGETLLVEFGFEVLCGQGAGYVLVRLDQIQVLAYSQLKDVNIAQATSWWCRRACCCRGGT